VCLLSVIMVKKRHQTAICVKCFVCLLCVNIGMDDKCRECKWEVKERERSLLGVVIVVISMFKY